MYPQIHTGKTNSNNKQKKENNQSPPERFILNCFVNKVNQQSVEGYTKNRAWPLGKLSPSALKISGTSGRDLQGIFLSAEVKKQGGNTDLTYVILDIDGVNVVNISIAALFN